MVEENSCGDAGGFTGMSWQFPYACAVLFLLKEGEQTIMTSFNDVTTFAHASGRVYIRKSMPEPLGCYLGFWN